VLVVDDQPINIRVLHMVLARDCQVLMATSAEQALAVCAAQHPDLVLMDVLMQGMDGYEACRQLKAQPATSDIPVVFVTAHQGPADREQGLAAGAQGFISKPVDPQEVLAIVRRILG
jgi:CheY-like chemotaxis protein